MIKRNQALLNGINAFLDFILVVVSYAFATWFRLAILRNDPGNIALSPHMLVIAAIYAAMVILIFTLLGFYNTTRTRSLSWKISMIFSGLTFATLIASTLLFVFRLEDFSRGVLVLFYGLSFGTLALKYAVMRWVFDRLRAKGYNIKHQVVIGNGNLASQYVEDVKHEPWLGIQIDRFVSAEDRSLDAILTDPDIDEAIIALEPGEYESIGPMIALCEKNGVRYKVIPFYNNIIPAHPIIENVGRSKLIDMRTNRLDNVGWWAVKRSFDLVASGLGLILLSPLLIAVSIGVKLSSPGPILFRQVRVGYKRREFQMLKFRSMKVNNSQDTAWSTNVDDRRTRFGSFIRKTSIDELPQLWNVFRGDMSLVGPRPELPHFVEQFKETIPFYMVKHQVKPGITGWAQVNGYRGDTSIEKRIELDLWYIDNWSPTLDLRILSKTLFGGMINQEVLK